MGKKILSASDYSVNMINTMVDHDTAGAMDEWVNGIVKSWLVKMMKAMAALDNHRLVTDKLTEGAKKLIVRAIMTIPKHDERTLLFATSLHLTILDLHHIPTDEAGHVTIKRVD